MMSRRIFLLFPLLCLGLSGQTRVRTGTLTLPGYEEGPPDPKPPFGPVYPYSLRNDLAGPQVRKTWRTVEIENEFLKCIVLPDLGGRVYSCLDKASKHDLFFANPVMKRNAAGPRGAEIAAGEEFDVPVTPGLVTMSPVDFAWRQNADGSATVFAGNSGRDGTRWVVELILRPGRALLEQHVTISNPDGVRHSYAWWERAAVPVFDDTRFCLPAYVTTDASGGEAQPWEGNLARPAQRFAYRSREGWFGVYSAREGGGTAHYANVEALPGKGFGYRGPEAIRNLTEGGNDFADMEPGLFGDKNGVRWMEPGETREFSEYWMPLRGLGGLSGANPNAAVFLERGKGGIQLGLQAFRAIPGAQFEVMEADQPLLQERVSLDPAKTLNRTIAKGKQPGTLRFQLRDEKGAILLEHTDGYFDAPHEVAKPAAPVSSSGDAGLRGLEEGRAAVREFRFAEAIPLLEEAPPIPERHLYLGLALIGQGDEAKARAVLTRAPADRLFGAPAQVELAKLSGRAGDRKSALNEVQAALRLRPGLAGAGALEVALLRANGMREAALKKLAGLRERDPADSILRFESVKLGTPDEELWKHLGADPARVLQTAEFYLRAGLQDDALELLSHRYPEVSAQEREVGTVLPQEDPLVSYERGYAHLKLGGSAREDFALASKQAVRYVWPNRPVQLLALRAALQANASDGTAHFLAGSFYLGGGIVEAGIREWREAMKRGFDYATLKNDLARLEESLRSRPPSKTATATAPVAARPAAEAIAAGKNPTRSAAGVTGTAEERAAAALIDLQRGRVQEAAAVFTQGNFPKERQSEMVKAAFIEVRLQTILDLAGRKRCSDMASHIEAIGEEDAGVPFSLYGFASVLKTARVHYLLAEAQSSCADEKAARKSFQRAVKAGERGSGVEYAYGQLAAAKLGSAITADPGKFSKDAEGLLAAGLLELAGGKKAEAADHFRAASAQAGGNALLRHWCEMALAGR